MDNVPFGLAAEPKSLKATSRTKTPGGIPFPRKRSRNFAKAPRTLRSTVSAEIPRSLQAFRLSVSGRVPHTVGTVNVLLETDSLNSAQRTHLDQIVRSLKHRYPEAGRHLPRRPRRGTVRKRSFRARTGAPRERKAPALMESRLFYAQLLYGAKHLRPGDGRSARRGEPSHGDPPEPYSLLAKLYHDQGASTAANSWWNMPFQNSPRMNRCCSRRLPDGIQGRFDDAERLYRRILALHLESAEANDAIATLGQKSPPGGGSSQTLLKPGTGRRSPVKSSNLSSPSIRITCPSAKPSGRVSQGPRI